MSHRFPTWVSRRWILQDDLEDLTGLLDELELRTVCQSAQCPNRGECWGHGTATFLILGEACTRNCAFCAVPGSTPKPVEQEEPRRIGEAVRRLDLRHVVVTSVTRDDLPDGGAAHFGATVAAIRQASPATTVEVLVPDFQGCREALACVLASEPDVFGHNIETVERLYPALRGAAHGYERALGLLRAARELAPHMALKSAFMVGHGETWKEVRQTLKDLRKAGCDAVNIGQYLQPTKKQLPVHEFVPPERFKEYEEEAYRLGFRFAAAGVFVRSSYRSEQLVEALDIQPRRATTAGGV